MLVGWSRAMTVRMQDAVIGRDILIGAVCGLALNLLDQLHRLTPRFLGWAEPIPAKPDVGVLEDTRYFLLVITISINNGLQAALLTVMMFTVFREIVRRIAARLKFQRVSADYLAAGRARPRP